MAAVSPAALLLLLPLLLLSLAPSVLKAHFPDADVNESSLEQLVGSQGRLKPTQRHNSSCCVRERKMKNIGISGVGGVTEASGEDILVDVGHCRRRCGGRRRHMKKPELERLMLENPAVDPRMLFLRHSGGRRGAVSCPGEEVCLASAWRVERLMTREGQVSVTVTEGCQCQIRSHSCRRQPRPVTLHKGTPLQTTHDLGDCQGHCSQDLGCRATKTRRVSVEGPNGAECVTVVEECGCEAPCYRAAQLHHLYNYTTPTSPQSQVIDIGTCIGECDTTTPEDHCVAREATGGCMMSLVKRSFRCSPTAIRHVHLLQADGSSRTLAAVTRCGCQ